MFTTSLIYFSGSGHTAKLAQLVAEGINSIDDAEIFVIDVEKMQETDWIRLDRSDGIIFGSPTYMGSAAAGFKLFIEKASSRGTWTGQKWTDKIAAGFTVATYPGGDKLNTLIELSVFAAQLGMIWVGQNHVGSRVAQDGLNINNDGSWLGLTATSSRDKTLLINNHDANTARLFGKRVAISIQRWNNNF